MKFVNSKTLARIQRAITAIGFLLRISGGIFCPKQRCARNEKFQGIRFSSVFFSFSLKLRFSLKTVIDINLAYSKLNPFRNRKFLVWGPDFPIKGVVQVGEFWKKNRHSTRSLAKWKIFVSESYKSSLNKGFCVWCKSHAYKGLTKWPEKVLRSQ